MQYMSFTPGMGLQPIVAHLSEAAPLALASDVDADPLPYFIHRQPHSVYDQSQLDCCVSCATTAAMETRSPQPPPLSPLFHYYVTRFEDHGTDAQDLVLLASGRDALSRHGICRRELHNQPFTQEGAQVVPSDEARVDAWGRRLGFDTRYPQIAYPTGPSRAAWMREQIKLDRAPIIGFTLPQNFLSVLNHSPYTWSTPGQFSSSSTGHCVIAVGFNSLYGFRIQDSQGTYRFDDGCWWMGYSVADSPLVQDVFTLF